jgi:hypothetical protein
VFVTLVEVSDALAIHFLDLEEGVNLLTLIWRRLHSAQPLLDFLCGLRGIADSSILKYRNSAQGNLDHLVV